jgi:hypothetical protein
VSIFVTSFFFLGELVFDDGFFFSIAFVFVADAFLLLASGDDFCGAPAFPTFFF